MPFTPFKPGTSGNPSGRPKGVRKVAKHIATETKEGAELVEYALKVFRAEGSKPKDKRWAHRWLTERYLGKPLQTIDVEMRDEAPNESIRDAMELLTDEQLDALAALEAAYAKARASVIAESADEPDVDGTPT